MISVKAAGPCSCQHDASPGLYLGGSNTACTGAEHVLNIRASSGRTQTGPMIAELAIGTVTIIASMAIMIGFMLATLRLVRRAEDAYADRRPALWQFFVLLSGTVTLVLLAHTICVWLWAALFRLLGVFPTLEEAVYFSLVSFTTVGYGDVVVDPGWRILSGFVAVNGLLAFGIFTAVLIEVIRSLSRRYMPRG